jgi:methylphosphotriester-DNA--protein-cysteine methyltransferase
VRHGNQTDARRRRRKFSIDFMGTDALKRLGAARLGFADPYQFSRAFKRVAGVSPRDFRNSP